MRKKPARLCSYTPYRLFSRFWWKELWDYPLRGIWRDISAFIHRGIYGWAPRDVWSLDWHLARVYAGALHHLSENNCGCPGTWELRPDGEYNFSSWNEQLREWAATFYHYANDNYHELYGTNDKAWSEDEDARSAALHQALREIEPWFGALWD